MASSSGYQVPRATNAAPSAVTVAFRRSTVERNFQHCALRAHLFLTSHLHPTIPLPYKSPSKSEPNQSPVIEISTPGNSSESAMPRSRLASLTQHLSLVLDTLQHYPTQKIVNNMSVKSQKEEVVRTAYFSIYGHHTWHHLRQLPRRN